MTIKFGILLTATLISAILVAVVVVAIASRSTGNDDASAALATATDGLGVTPITSEDLLREVEGAPTAPPIPNLDGYEPTAGCKIDHLYEKEGSVWSTVADTALRPVIVPKHPFVRNYDVDAFPVAMICLASSPLASNDGSHECIGGTAVAGEDGWIRFPNGERRPNIPFILQMSAGSIAEYEILMPLRPGGVINVDCFEAS